MGEHIMPLVDTAVDHADTQWGVRQACGVAVFMGLSETAPAGS